MGAVILGIGMFAVVVDITLHRRNKPRRERNPWNAGTLEWISEPEENWGVRSIPRIESRYPLWEQEDLARQVREGSWYLADAGEGRRETLGTSVLDAEPEQVLRVGGTSVVTIFCAITLGAVFVALTFKWWLIALVASVAFLAGVIYWLWTGTGEIPERAERNIGRGISLPIYASGPKSTGWWAMFITMTGDGAAFASLVFGYFFFWTRLEDFTGGHEGPGVIWPSVSLALFIAAWSATVGAREVNRRDQAAIARVLLSIGVVLAAAGCAAALAGPWVANLDPTAHVYGAIVWTLAIWAAAHGAVGVVMQLYCLARSWVGRLTPNHDMDLRNVALYWHFMLITAVFTFGVIGFFPEAL
jgi:cytochrome c oxidase subunit I+III